MRAFIVGKKHTSHQHDLKAVYANYFQVGCNAFEFIIDFGQLYEDQASERFHTRIVTNPMYAKELLQTLEESIRVFESSYRKITNDEN